MSKFLPIEGFDVIVNIEEIISARRDYKTIVIVFKTADDTHIILDYRDEDKAKSAFKGLAASLNLRG